MYHSIYYISCGSLAGTRNSSMGPPSGIDLTTTNRTWTDTVPLSYDSIPSWVSCCCCCLVGFFNLVLFCFLFICLLLLFVVVLGGFFVFVLFVLFFLGSFVLFLLPKYFRPQYNRYINVLNTSLVYFHELKKQNKPCYTEYIWTDGHTVDTWWLAGLQTDHEVEDPASQQPTRPPSPHLTLTNRWRHMTVTSYAATGLGHVISRHTVRRRLRQCVIRAYRPFRGVALTSQHRLRRLHWARQFQRWQRILFSGESRFQFSELMAGLGYTDVLSSGGCTVWWFAAASLANGGQTLLSLTEILPHTVTCTWSTYTLLKHVLCCQIYSPSLWVVLYKITHFTPSESSDRSFMGRTHWAISRSSQCSTTGITKAVVCAILSVEWCI